MKYDGIQTAVVGAGFIGPVHVEALRRLGIPVRGILGCDESESQRARQSLGLARSYRSLEEILSDAEVTAVHLAVPNRLHFDMSRLALQARKHVMCEKPLAMNSRETAELVALARDSGRVAGVCYNVRFYPLNLEARSRVMNGELGTIHAVNGSYVQDWLLLETDYNWRVLTEQGGELRAVADIGTHWMDLVLTVTGLEVEAVFADLRTVHPVRQRPKGEVETFSGGTAGRIEREPVRIATEDYGAVLLRFRGGARGSFHVSQVTAGRKNSIRYEIAGSSMTLAWESEKPNQLWFGHRSSPNQVLTRDPALTGDLARPFMDYPGGHNEGFPDTFKQCFKAFYDYIAQDDLSAERLFPTFEAGHREVMLCEAILRSHREQRWIEVEEVGP